MKIVIAGGTGFIGDYLVKKYKDQGYDVWIISRNELANTQVSSVTWSDDQNLERAMNHADVLINMAGKSVDCRYNAANKKVILDSRIQTTQKLGEVLARVDNPPKLWINSSTATIYRHAQDRPMTEKGGEIGAGFSVDVATSWERTFFQSTSPNTRKVAIRTAIVLGQTGGAFQHFRMLAKMGFGGRQGNGKQMVSFVHIEDVYRAIEYIRLHQDLKGVLNVAAPNPITNSTFMQSFRTVLGKSFGLPIYKWMLEIGAFVLRTETELLLKSRWVVPEILDSQGFVFHYKEIYKALENLNRT